MQIQVYNKRPQGCFIILSPRSLLTLLMYRPPKRFSQLQRILSVKHLADVASSRQIAQPGEPVLC